MSVDGPNKRSPQGVRRRGFDAVHSSLTAFLKGFCTSSPQVGLKRAKPASCPLGAQCSGPKLWANALNSAVKPTSKDGERRSESWETDIQAVENTENTVKDTIELVRNGLNGHLTLSGSLWFSDLQTYGRSGVQNQHLPRSQ